MVNKKIKILYIAGPGRCGSTLLHNILGQSPGFLAIGEFRDVWERGFIRNRLCGCGMQFQECPMWQEIFHAAYGGLDYVDAHQLLQLAERFDLLRLPLLHLSSRDHKCDVHVRQYLCNLEKVYRAIQATTGCRVIVDSSKSPTYAYLLRMIPDIDLYVLNIIRDSRAVVYAWSKKKLREPSLLRPDYFARKSALKSAIHWNARNIATEIFLGQPSDKYMMLRYEDFLVTPQESVVEVLSWLNEKITRSSFVESHVVTLTQVNHSVSGNPVRFETGVLGLQQDMEWQIRMQRANRLLTTLLTFPLLHRYGYK